MLGRVRPSSYTLECLELERPPSKTVKGDSLSVYEATILKLRQGSLASTSEHVTEEIDDDSSFIPPNMLSSSITSMAIVMDETSHISTSCLTSSSSGLSNENNKTSIAYMFARYKRNCQQSRSVFTEDPMMVESNSSSGSSCTSPDDTLVFDPWPQTEKPQTAKKSDSC